MSLLSFLLYVHVGGQVFSSFSHSNTHAHTHASTHARTHAGMHAHMQAHVHAHAPLSSPCSLLFAYCLFQNHPYSFPFSERGDSFFFFFLNDFQLPTGQQDVSLHFTMNLSWYFLFLRFLYLLQKKTNISLELVYKYK